MYRGTIFQLKSVGKKNTDWRDFEEPILWGQLNKWLGTRPPGKASLWPTLRLSTDGLLITFWSRDSLICHRFVVSMKWRGCICSAWHGAQLMARAASMFSGITRVTVASGTKGRLRHSHHGWKGFKLRSKHSPHPCTCTKGSVNQHSGNAVCSSLCLWEWSRDRNAPHEAGSAFVRAAEQVWRRGDHPFCLERNVTVSLYKGSL